MKPHLRDPSTYYLGPGDAERLRRRYIPHHVRRRRSWCWGFLVGLAVGLLYAWAWGLVGSI